MIHFDGTNLLLDSSYRICLLKLSWAPLEFEGKMARPLLSTVAAVVLYLELLILKSTLTVSYCGTTMFGGKFRISLMSSL